MRPGSSGSTRAAAFRFLAKLDAHSGDVDSAFAMLDRAERESPADIFLVFERALLYLELGDLPAASKIIAETEARPNLSSLDRRNLLAVKELYARKRAEPAELPADTEKQGGR